MKLRLKHNKKRNTAFLYESLVRELTKAVIKKDFKRKNLIISLVKEHFKPGTMLSLELDLYKAIYEMTDVELHTADKLLFEIRLGHKSVDKKKLFLEQSRLISKINRKLSKSVYNNFVPSYKTIATIYQLFNNAALNTKQRVVLEENLARKMTSRPEQIQEGFIADHVVFKAFLQRFNAEYKNLLQEQKELLSKYIFSFSDNGMSFKLYLNEEVGRLKEIVKKSLKLDEIKNDDEMQQKTEDVIVKLENYKAIQIDDDIISEILKIQELAEEIKS